MLRLTYAALSVALLVALMFCLERPAYAYVDPGSGLLVWQSAGTIFTGMIFYFRRRVKRLFQRAANRSKDNSSTR
jgi:hypothetical protein